MTRPVVIARVLYIIAGVFVVLGLWLRARGERVEPPAATLAPDAVGEPPADGVTRAQSLLSFQTIANLNMFSADRTPPPGRFRPDGGEADSADPAAAEPATPPGAPRIRLTGTAVAPSGAVALIDADADVPGAEIYRVGDSVGAERLVDIAESYVVLVGPAGRRVISLGSPGN